jgi:hypothetical protein
MHNPQRSETTVPQQALFFMNAPFVVEQSRALAARVVSENNPTNKIDPAMQVRKLYRLVYQREPTVREMNRALAFVKASEATTAEEKQIPKSPSAWKYGFGEMDDASKHLKNFEGLPHFTGEAWQGGKNWPDEKLGWAQLTASGGHAGNDLQHAVVRRWVAPASGVIAIEGTLKHEHKEGDGIRAFLLHNQTNVLGHWTIHDEKLETKVARLEIKAGDSVDFVVSIYKSLNNNDFVWAPTLRMLDDRDRNGYAREWNAAREFAGPPGEERKPLTPWEQYAQVLLLSNEFLFVD